VRAWRYAWAVPVAVAGMVLLAMLSGHQLQPTWPEYAWALLFVNLVVTCFAEELFFRGALQRELMLYLAPLPAIVIAAVAFGLVHVGRGWEFALLATVAGLLYGTIYRRTGMLSMAVLTHFLVNAAWILLLPTVR
jgi:membrane protease YdiL (CAAX protease family)